MWQVAYHTALLLGLALASPWLAYRLANGRYRRIAQARLGVGSSWLPRPIPGCLWVHALSVGEVRSALPLLRALLQRHPERGVAFSVSTAQGWAVAQEALASLPGVELFVRPLDLPWAVPRLLNHLRPALFCLVEGDIWPAWQWGLAQRRVPCLLVNSRVSPRTFRGYQRLAPLARQLLGGFDRILAQTKVDQERLLAVGAPAQKVQVAGNLKFDSAPAALSPEERARLAAEWGLAGREALVAGSTHAGEEEACLAAYAQLRQARPGLSLILAPREVARGQALASLARGQGMEAWRLSQGQPPAGTQVLVLDVLGRLAEAYALGVAAFVGGSLVGVGGHNLLEPAAQGVPVLYGPRTHNFLEMARDLEACGGGLRVQAGSELAAAWGDLLQDPDLASRMGRAAREFCQQHRGALERVLRHIEDLLPGGGS